MCKNSLFVKCVFPVPTCVRVCEFMCTYVRWAAIFRLVKVGVQTLFGINDGFGDHKKLGVSQKVREAARSCSAVLGACLTVVAHPKCKYRGLQFLRRTYQSFCDDMCTQDQHTVQRLRWPDFLQSVFEETDASPKSAFRSLLALTWSDSNGGSAICVIGAYSQNYTLKRDTNFGACIFEVLR